MTKLEERIKKYDIPPLLYAPVFDRCLVYQIDTVESDTFEGSCLVKPEVTKRRERNGSPRGVLVGAGLKALDILGSHGIELGDIVWFARMAMWKHEIDASNRVFSVIRAGEITGSEDLQEALGAGDIRYHLSDDETWEIEGVRRAADPQEFEDT